MSLYQVKEYGVTIGISVESTNFCCGVHNAGNFFVNGRTGRLSKIKINNLYKLLYRKIRASTKKILVCHDAVEGGWSQAGGQSSRTDDVSLQGMCEYLKFKVTRGVSPSTGYTIATYTDSFMYRDELGEVRSKRLPPAPRIPKPKVPKVSKVGLEGDLQRIIKFIETH